MYINKRKKVQYNQGGDLGATLGSQIGGYALGAAGQAIGIPMPVGMAVGNALGGAAGKAVGDQFGDNTPIKPPNQGVIPQESQINQSMGLNPYGNSMNYALGGPLNRPQITEYVGPRHENGGLALGNTNTEVEGGEVRVGDFVFSDRLDVPDGDVSFAKAAKAIQEKYNDRKNDKIDNDTMMRELAQLAKAQESVKVERSIEKENSLNRQGGSPEIKAKGGPLSNKNTKKLYYGGVDDNDPDNDTNPYGMYDYHYTGSDGVKRDIYGNPLLSTTSRTQRNNNGRIDIDSETPIRNDDGVEVGRKYNTYTSNRNTNNTNTNDGDIDLNAKWEEINPGVPLGNYNEKINWQYNPFSINNGKDNPPINDNKNSNDPSSENKFKNWLKKLGVNWDKLSPEDKQKLKDKYSSGNINMDDLTKTGLSTLGGIYDVARGLSGGNYESYGRLNPVRLNQMDPTRAIQQQREVGQAGMSNIRNVGGQGIGQYLSNVGNIASGTQKNIGNIRSKYDQANTGILNKQAQLNSQIQGQNLGLDIQQNDINARERDAASSDIQKGLTTISQGLNQQFQDQARRKVQSQMLDNWIGTNDYKSLTTSDGEIPTKKLTMNGTNYYISGVDGDTVYNESGNPIGKISKGFFGDKNNNDSNNNNSNNNKKQKQNQTMGPIQWTNNKYNT